MSGEIKELKDVQNQRGYLIYSRDVTQKHSRAAQRLLDLVIHQFELGFQDAENGKKVIWTSARCVPLVYAAGVTPLIILDIVRYGESEMVPEAENLFQIPAEICSMIKAEMGGLYNYRNTKVKRVAITGSGRCEPEYLVSAQAEQYGYESYIIDVPQKPKNLSGDRLKRMEKLYHDEYTRFVHWLSGKEIDKEKLHTELIRANRIKDKLLRLQHLENRHNLYLRTIASMLARCGEQSYYGQPELYESIIDDLLEELEALPEGAYHDENLAKIVWSGARGIDFSSYIAVDRVGAHVEGWEMVGNLFRKYNEEIDPFEALIQYHMSENNTNEHLGSINKAIDRQIQLTNAKGLIIYHTQGCTFMSTAYELRRKYYAQKNFPVLMLVGTMQKGELNGQTLMRLGAFVEMLK